MWSWKNIWITEQTSVHIEEHCNVFKELHFNFYANNFSVMSDMAFFLNHLSLRFSFLLQSPKSGHAFEQSYFQNKLRHRHSCSEVCSLRSIQCLQQLWSRMTFHKTRAPWMCSVLWLKKNHLQQDVNLFGAGVLCQLVVLHHVFIQMWEPIGLFHITWCDWSTFIYSMP
jgi:hypothetical protein